MYLFFENATPRMNDVVFKMEIELMRRTPNDLRVRRTFFQEREGSKLYAEFRIRGGPRNRPTAYTGGELYMLFHDDSPTFVNKQLNIINKSFASVINLTISDRS